VSLFTSLGLNSKIMKAVDEMGYKEPTPIQTLAIPKILEGADLFASAQTGTGKTAAFMLPIINLLADQPEKKTNKPSILILVPTRELAMQVADEAKKYTKYLPNVKTICIYGGVPYPIQRRSLSSRYDILVATPGRLLDYMEQKRIDLSCIKLLVLDEADRMLDMGFIDDVEQIAANTPTDRQTLLFSATLDRKMQRISQKLQKNPFEIQIQGDRSAEKNIEQRLYYVDNLSHKMRLLEHLLETVDFNQTIVFTSTIVQADEIANVLYEKGHQSGSLHGDMNQRQRTKTIDKMRRGDLRILVATDVAARGIDISTLTHVINFDLPMQAENFIHRMGRTGRAGAKGIAISFATYRENHLVSQINKMLGKPLDCHTIEGMEPQKKDASRRFNPGNPGGNRGGSFPRKRDSKASPFPRTGFRKKESFQRSGR
jgi:superfamily II DNA/RNA helicase